MKISVFVFAFILLLCSSGCKRDKNFPMDHQISVISENNLEKIDSTLSPEKNYTIMVYYDGNCSSCYKELAKWKVLEQEFKEKFLDVEFKYVLSAYNKAILKDYLNQIKFSTDKVFYDVNEKFIKEYPFFYDADYIHSSALLDNNNVILEIGNPTNSIGDKNQFISRMD